MGEFLRTFPQDADVPCRVCDRGDDAAAVHAIELDSGQRVTVCAACMLGGQVYTQPWDAPGE